MNNTFCPAKWSEIAINLSAGYVYACCKATPIKIIKKEDISNSLKKQKDNLILGIQDPTCAYCWDIENAGFSSLRHDYLEKFDRTTIDQYINDTVKYKKVEINLGNECNFQCTYCNPKFSSQWESDVKNNPYKIFSDRHFYEINEKNANNVDDSINWLSQIDTIENLEIIGGEPLQNKNFFKVIDKIKSHKLGIVTNLSCKTIAPLEKIIEISKQYDELKISISLDSTRSNAEFSRYGLNYELILKNINYLLEYAPNNIQIQISSLMTSITIRDFTNIIELIEKFYQQRPKILWFINLCKHPSILSMATLPDRYRLEILNQISSLKDKKYIFGLETLEGGIKSVKFNQTIYNQMKHFLEDFSSRKGIKIPVDLNF